MTRRPKEFDEEAEIARAALEPLLESVPAEARRSLLSRAGALIREQRQRERERCTATCRRRAELWRTTSSSRSSVALVREEARARANEALYLADLLASGEELPGLSPVNDEREGSA